MTKIKSDYVPVGEVHERFAATFIEDRHPDKTIMLPYVEFHMDTEAAAKRIGELIAMAVFGRVGLSAKCVGAIVIKMDDENTWSDDYAFQQGVQNGLAVMTLYTPEEAEASGMPVYTTDVEGHAAEADNAPTPENTIH